MCQLTIGEPFQISADVFLPGFNTMTFMTELGKLEIEKDVICIENFSGGLTADGEMFEIMETFNELEIPYLKSYISINFALYPSSENNGPFNPLWLYSVIKDELYYWDFDDGNLPQFWFFPGRCKRFTTETEGELFWPSKKPNVLKDALFVFSTKELNFEALRELFSAK